MIPRNPAAVHDYTHGGSHCSMYAFIDRPVCREFAPTNFIPRDRAYTIPSLVLAPILPSLTVHGHESAYRPHGTIGLLAVHRCGLHQLVTCIRFSKLKWRTVCWEKEREDSVLRLLFGIEHLIVHEHVEAEPRLLWLYTHHLSIYLKHFNCHNTINLSWLG